MKVPSFARVRLNSAANVVPSRSGTVMRLMDQRVACGERLPTGGK
jgi:hypothetical protein